MGRIVLDRESNYLAVLAAFDIFIDEKKFGNIRDGGHLVFEIDNGFHSMYLRNGILPIGKSNVLNLNIKENTETRIYVRPTMGNISGIKLELKSVVSLGRTEEKEPTNKFDEIQKLLELKESGILTEAEFENEKKKLLNN